MVRKKRCGDRRRRWQESKRIKPNHPRMIPKAQTSPSQGSNSFQWFFHSLFLQKKTALLNGSLHNGALEGTAAAAASPCVCRPHAGGVRTSARKTVPRTVFCFAPRPLRVRVPSSGSLFCVFAEKNRVVFLNHSVHNGALEGTRTPGLLVRSMLFYVLSVFWKVAKARIKSRFLLFFVSLCFVKYKHQSITINIK